MLNQPLVFLDVETTGCSYNHDRIIEIGLIRVENQQVTHTYQTLLNPQRPLPPEITRLTGITPQELETAPTFNQIKPTLLEYLDHALLVAHNARFDYGFLKHEFDRLEYQFTTKTLCTVRLSRMLFPRCRRHNLDAVIKRLNLEVHQRHRAFDDAQALWQFIQYLTKNFTPDTITQALTHQLKRPSLPPAIKTKTIDSLTESPGVYIFYNQDGAPLYVGKSVNLKTRILSHFSSTLSSTREQNLASQTTDLETIPTTGDLGAQLLESQLIKNLQPIYNRKLRRLQKFVTLTQTQTDNYLNFTLNPQTGPQDLDFTQPLAVFRSKNQAQSTLRQLVADHQLCPKLTGLENTPKNKPCFAYHLGNCLGACVSKELPAKYNLRHIKAFTTLKLQSWPFPGTIAITETYQDKTTTHLFHHWCYLKSINENGSLPPTPHLPPTTFDLDTYHILIRFLKTPRHYHSIKLLNPSI